MAAIVFLVTGIFTSGKINLQYLFSYHPNVPQGASLITAVMAAAAGAFWAYDGWNNITFIAGEIQSPQQTIPKSLWLGLTVCIITYALVNLAFVCVMPVSQIAASNFIAADAASVIWGTAGAAFIVLLVVISTMGTTNSNILATARVTYAIGTENKWFKAAQKVHSRFQTPTNALLINAAWTIVLIFSGSFDTLTDMLIFISWLFYGMSALGIFILRYKLKNINRPYKVWGYPFIPAAFLLFTSFFLCSTVYTDIMNYRNGTAPIIHSLFGLLITMVGIPVYFLSKK